MRRALDFWITASPWLLTLTLTPQPPPPRYDSRLLAHLPQALIPSLTPTLQVFAADVGLKLTAEELQPWRYFYRYGSG